MKAYWEWRNNSTILDLNNNWTWVVSFKPPLLYSWGSTPPPQTHCKGGWMNLRLWLDVVEKRETSFHWREWNPRLNWYGLNMYTWIFKKSENVPDDYLLSLKSWVLLVWLPFRNFFSRQYLCYVAHIPCHVSANIRQTINSGKFTGPVNVLLFRSVNSVSSCYPLVTPVWSCNVRTLVFVLTKLYTFLQG
jgi:hypothetical protein